MASHRFGRKRSLEITSDNEPWLKRFHILDDEELELEMVSSSSDDALVAAMMRSLEQVIEQSHSEDALSSSSSPSSAVLERYPSCYYANDEAASVASSVDEEDDEQACVTSPLQGCTSDPRESGVSDANSLLQDLLDISDEHLNGDSCPLQNSHSYWEFLESAELGSNF